MLKKFVLLHHNYKTKTMTRIEKFEMRKVYNNLYSKHNLEQLKKDFKFFIERGYNDNNNNKEEYAIHI